ncbi:vegetative cell wall protein gp1-like [Cryptomeria japonica]|uniref:vegetative cell wall protein gp1-like n=1 Tax=Cryptomeria japonica TaxID=3369 RepID=UPI0027D9D060|nr:vegetative cell wall protein gp1-like [Cryptomeria japonica]
MADILRPSHYAKRKHLSQAPSSPLAPTSQTTSVSPIPPPAPRRKRGRAPVIVNVVPIQDVPPASSVRPPPIVEPISEASPMEHDAPDSSQPAAPPSPEFITTPLPETDNLVRVPSSPSESLASSPEACMFGSLEDISALSTIFTRSLTLASSELEDKGVATASSLALAAGEGPDVALAIVPLRAYPPSPYDLDWEDGALLQDDDILQYDPLLRATH